ncbi:MAG: hypothetical protein ACJ0HC_04745 [Gammaproteobacteria bacterium]
MQNSQNTNTEADYLSLSYLLNLIKNYFNILLLIGFLSGAFSVFYALSLNDYYTSSAKFVPVTNTQESTDLGGIAGMAAGLGLGLGDASGGKMNLVLEVLESTDFFNELYLDEKFIIELSAIDTYDRDNKTVSIDSEIYNINKSEWIENTDKFTKTEKPSLLEAKEKFHSDHLAFAVDIETNFLSIEITHASPFIAQEWLTRVYKLVDEYIQIRDVQDLKETITYIDNQIEQSNSNQVRRALSNILESQMKTLMLSEVSSGYVIKVLDSPSFPELKSGPGRAIICIVLTFLGSLLGYFFVLLWDLNKSRRFLG